MSPSGDGKFSWQRSAVVPCSRWGSSNQVLLNLAAPRAVQMQPLGQFKSSIVELGSPLASTNEIQQEPCWHAPS